MKTKKRVLLFVETSTGFGREIFRGITSYVRERNRWQINIENRGFYDPLPEWLADWTGDGIISRSAQPETLAYLHGLKIPVVELHGDDALFPKEVYCNREKIAQLAASHFLDNGLAHIAFYTYGRSWWIRRRREAFAAELEKRGIEMIEPPPTSESTLGDGANPVWEIGDERRLLDWLKKLPKPAGVFTGFDPAAIRVISACDRLGLRVPEEVAPLGAGNDVCLCEAVTPALSSIDLDSFQIGYEAAKRLDRRMTNAESNRKSNAELSAEDSGPIIVSPGGLIARGSTDVINTRNGDIALAIRYLRDHALSGLKIADVLDALDLSAKTLQRGVQQVLGRTPEQEMIRVRMETAVRMLRETTLSPTEIADRCGFSSAKYFTGAFRRHYGQTPAQFREGKRGRM